MAHRTKHEGSRASSAPHLLAGLQSSSEVDGEAAAVLRHPRYQVMGRELSRGAAGSAGDQGLRRSYGDQQGAGGEEVQTAPIVAAAAPDWVLVWRSGHPHLYPASYPNPCLLHTRDGRGVESDIWNVVTLTTTPRAYLRRLPFPQPH
jgi:hypothetical protein